MNSDNFVDEEPADIRSARLAHVLAQAVRSGELNPTDALRVLRNELRQRNTNKQLKILTRSVGAQSVIDHYGEQHVPKNDSDDALHADHVHPLTEATLQQVQSVSDWLVELKRLRIVVCVTARENYALELIEKQGFTGPEKYAKAGIVFVGGDAAGLPSGTLQ